MTWKSARQRATLVVLPLCLFIVIRALDHFQYAHAYGYWNRAQTAALDEPAHLSTAVIGLLIIGSLPVIRRYLSFFFAASAGSMLIDLDHIALYAGVPGIAATGRPVTHSLATVFTLVAAGLFTRGRARQIVLGLSCGVLLHLTRDISTGPGVPLWWPINRTAQQISYSTYIHGLEIATTLATVRQLWPIITRPSPR